MESKRYKILVVEDHEINRKVLVHILQKEYDTVEAANGQEALDILKSEKKQIAAILLDIMMPVMNGYEFLERIDQKGYQNIPIIVMTGENDPETEQKALQLGAWDFVSKPYKAQVLQTRLINAIARSEISLLRKIRHMAEHDELTDLYNRRHFFEVTQELLHKNKHQHMIFGRMDLNRFKLINSFYGEERGDALLKSVAKALKEELQDAPAATYGRIEGDIFGFCVPYETEKLKAHLDRMVAKLAVMGQDLLLEPVFGLFIVGDQELSTEELYLRATMAAKQCKNKYMVHYEFYDEAMGRQLFEEQEILQDMQSALDSEQFLVYLQPKYNLQTKLPYGAEALVRWQHPKKGMIAPGKFIPVLEKNGFIGKLDIYMWEKICQLLKRWDEEGIKSGPISVNMSRIDVSNPNLVDILKGLIEKYQIQPSMFNLELTESAYMDNPENIKRVIGRLHEAGFSIFMDDFGSGYSSLNTLKDFEVDVLKIDMQFLSVDEANSKSKKILTSIVRMAGWLNLPVIVEGVETKAQNEFLESIGCEYIQGFYYAKPMPVAQYEALIKDCDPIPAQINSYYRDGFHTNNLPEKLVKQLYKDELTQAYNRRYLNEWLFLKLEDEMKLPYPFCVVMIDVNNFKRINDTYGHRAGDEALQKTVTVLKKNIRYQDSIIRYGGDEFLIVLVNCTEDVIKRKIVQFQNVVQAICLENCPAKLAIDVGYSYTNAMTKNMAQLESMIQEADAFMYQHKKAQRLQRGGNA